MGRRLGLIEEMMSCLRCSEMVRATLTFQEFIVETQSWIELYFVVLDHVQYHYPRFKDTELHSCTLGRGRRI